MKQKTVISMLLLLSLLFIIPTVHGLDANTPSWYYKFNVVNSWNESSNASATITNGSGMYINTTNYKIGTGSASGFSASASPASRLSLTGSQYQQTGSGSYSICFWINASGVGDAGYAAVILWFGDTTTATSTNIDASGKAHIVGPNSLTSATVISNSTFVHYCQVQNSVSGNQTIYINGAFSATGTRNTLAVGNTVTTIGAQYNTAGNTVVKQIDDLKIWKDYALNSTEVLTVYQSTETITRTLSININNLVNGSSISSFCINATGTNTTQNICTTNGTASFNTTGIYNITAYNISNNTYFNVTQLNYNFSTTDTINLSTYQSLLNITAKQLYTNNSVQSFNITNQQITNTTTSGSLIIPANTGSNDIKINVSGNYSLNKTCTAISFSIADCVITGIYDSIYSFNANNTYNNVAITNFSLQISNNSLGGIFYNQSTTNGSLNISLLQGYNYLVQFTTTSGAFEYKNITLPANASTHFYQFKVLPTPSINITIKDATTGNVITQNVTILFSSNSTGDIVYTTSGGYFKVNLTPEAYTIKIYTTNYSQSVYTVTATQGAVYYLTAYLQQNASDVIFQFVDSIASTVVIPEVLVTQQKLVNGSWVSIANRVTDITGRTSFGYNPTTQYRFLAVKQGYLSKQFDLDPILFSSYTIKLQRSTTIDFSQDFQGIYMNYNPQLFYDGQENTINITFNSALGVLTLYNYSIQYPGGTKTGSGNNVLGEIFTVPFNISGAQSLDKVNITLTYQTSIGNPRTFEYSNLIIINPGNNTFIANKGKTYGMGLIERALVGTFIIIIVAGMITVATGSVFGLTIALIIMGIFIKIGFWEWWLAGLSFLVGFAIISARSD